MPSISLNQPWLRPLSGPEEEQELQAAAKADGHQVVLPRFIVTRTEGEGARIIGAVGAWPVWQCWMHTREAKARDSLRALKQLEERVRQAGVPLLCLPCTKESPFWNSMERMGYRHGWDTGLFFKSLA